MILTLVPNPSLDKIVTVPGFTAGQAFHAADVRRYAGGKGFHFARALHTLGGDPFLVCPLGGEVGRIVERLARDEGIPTDAQWLGGETRSGLVIVDPVTHRITELYETGPALTQRDWEQVLEKIIGRIPSSKILAVSGSFPPGTPEDGLIPVLRIARRSGCQVLLDSYGPVLRSTFPEHPDVLKINHHEAGDLVGRPVEDREQAVEAAREIQGLGAQSVVITLGSEGTVGVSVQGEFFAWLAPRVDAVFPVGSGDSFFAGLVHGLAAGKPLSEAARMGVAAGSANALTLGPGDFRRADVETLLNQIQQ